MIFKNKFIWAMSMGTKNGSDMVQNHRANIPERCKTKSTMVHRRMKLTCQLLRIR